MYQKPVVDNTLIHNKVEEEGKTHKHVGRVTESQSAYNEMTCFELTAILYWSPQRVCEEDVKTRRLLPTHSSGILAATKKNETNIIFVARNTCGDDHETVGKNISALQAWHSKTF